MLLWVNLHGGWLFGTGAARNLHLAAFVESVRAQNNDAFAAIRAAHRARAMGWAWAASVMATLVNPFGWRLHVHIYRYLTDRYLMNRIDEFQSPDFHGWAQRCFAVILMLVLIAFAEQSSEGTAQSSARRAAGGVCGILFVAQSSGLVDAAGADRWADAVGELRFARG